MQLQISAYCVWELQYSSILKVDPGVSTTTAYLELLLAQVSVNLPFTFSQKLLADFSIISASPYVLPQTWDLNKKCKRVGGAAQCRITGNRHTSGRAGARALPDRRVDLASRAAVISVVGGSNGIAYQYTEGKRRNYRSFKKQRRSRGWSLPRSDEKAVVSCLTCAWECYYSGTYQNKRECRPLHHRSFVMNHLEPSLGPHNALHIYSWIDLCNVVTVLYNTPALHNGKQWSYWY